MTNSTQDDESRKAFDCLYPSGSWNEPQWEHAKFNFTQGWKASEARVQAEYAELVEAAKELLEDYGFSQMDMEELAHEVTLGNEMAAVVIRARNALTRIAKAAKKGASNG